MSTIHVDVVSAEGEIFSGEAEMLFAPASQGDIGVAPRHAPLLTTLRPGEVRVQLPGDVEKMFYVTGGIMEVQPYLVTVMADTTLREDELDEAAALQAKQRAEEMLAGKFGEVDLAQAQLELAEAAARYRAAQRLKGKRG